MIICWVGFLVQAATDCMNKIGGEMELRQALKEQYHAGLAMLAECVEKCPEGMWLEGDASGLSVATVQKTTNFILHS